MSSGEEEESVKVAVRMRIYNQREKDAGSQLVIRMKKEIKGSKTWIRNPETEEEKEFKYDYSFNTHSDDPAKEEKIGPFADQDYVFRELGVPVLETALEGRNTCLFAYGQTGAGKSYSMLGSTSDPDKFGIIPRSCIRIFEVIAENKKNPLCKSSVSLQVVEIYCEQVNDLLSDRKKWPAGGHKPRLTKDGYACDTVTQPCSNYKEIEETFQFADKNRSIGSHALNPSSSRAHTIYIIRYEKKTRNSEEATMEETVSSRINLVDLAGSERTESAGTSGQMLKEGNAINLSLTALGNCIHALSEGKRPGFRDSKLTLLLQGSMTNGKVIMIAAISPASICYEESVSTLRFAERIKQVKIKSKKNVTIDPVAEIKKEMEEMRQRMQQEIDELKGRVGGDGSWSPTSSALNANTEEAEELKRLLEEQRANEEALKEDMKRQIEEAKKTAEDKAAEAAAHKADWSSALGGIATEKKEDITVPHLLNLNPDERLAETLIYKLKEGESIAGRRNKEKEPDLEFSGMGMMKEHCKFIWEGNSVKLINTAPAAKSFVNGVPLEDEGEGVELKHNDRVWLGNNYAFRFAFPGQEDKAGPLPEEAEAADYHCAEQELADYQSKQLERREGEESTQMDAKLSEALKKIEQANIISSDLSRDAIFQPKIIAGPNGEKQIVVYVGLPNGTLTWPWEKFDVRMIEMVQLWEQWQNAQDEGKSFELPKAEHNPFVDLEYQLIGEASVWLHSLANMMDSQLEPPILSLSAAREGTLKVELIPLDEKKCEGPWDDEPELDPFVEDPSELVGKKVNFAVKVNRALLEVDMAAGGRAKYKDTWVRYKIRNILDRNDPRDGDPLDKFVETTHDKMATLSPLYEHKQNFETTVTHEFLDHLKKGKVIFQLWGKLVEDPLPNAKSRANSTVYGLGSTMNSFSGGVLGNSMNIVLPVGWRRVHAFMDPQGNLHYDIPKELLENTEKAHTVADDMDDDDAADVTPKKE